MIDVHNHLLYGVDDGPETIEESVAMLLEAKRQGVEAIILTPHYRHAMFAYPTEMIERHFARLKEVASEMDVEIYLGTEFHINSKVVEYLDSGRCKTMAGSNYVLAEYDYDTNFGYIQSTVREMLAHGYVPIIAHVERYGCMYEDEEHAMTLREMGALIQINAEAVIGGDGRRLKQYCKKILRNGDVDLVGSDSHGIKKRPSKMAECYKYMLKKYDEEYVYKLFEENPRKILNVNRRG